MQQLVETFISIEREISSEKGGFTLFALILLEDAFNKWDVVVCAPWLKSDERESYDYIVKHVKAHLKQKEMLTLARIVILKEDNPGLDAIHEAINTEHNSIEIKDSNFFGLEIKHAYIITSRKQDFTLTAKDS